MDVDQMIKQWWRVAPKAFRRIRPRPRIVLLFTRLPARLTVTDRIGWLHKISKTALSFLAFGTGTADRVLYIAGRDDLAKGVWLKRVRDPAICTAHSDDRVAIRRRLGLPQDRKLVGILGGISNRKNVPMVADAVRQAGPDVDLLLAGTVFEDVESWLDTLTDADRQRVIVRNGFLTNEQLDEHVAACDIVAIAHDNNGPSGIMGKAVAAGVPVLSAGSKVRLRECNALRAGIDAPLSPRGLADGIRHLLRAPAPGLSNQDLLPTGEEFAEVILGRAVRRSRSSVGVG
jgi:glycosyltransferase involved in cell wall biosynthesis